MYRPTFSKRHYILIAQALNDLGQDRKEVPHTVRTLAHLFGRDNYNFDRERFEDACTEWTGEPEKKRQARKEEQRIERNRRRREARARERAAIAASIRQREMAEAQEVRQEAAVW